ncbi:MAG: GAF domain-containing protein [Chloroflexi bacterium]|nr:GAF domain-containing protein [Chloroflexota bacterium]
MRDAVGSSINSKEINVPDEIVAKWQSAVNILAEALHVPAALIMKAAPPYIEIFRSSESRGNPYQAGHKEHLAGLYCETVIATRDKLLVANALQDPDWDQNPDVALGMVSYLGFPLLWPDGEVFGTICLLDCQENRYGRVYEELLLQFKELIEAHLSLLYQRNEREEAIGERMRVQEQLEALRQVGLELTTELNLDALLHSIVLRAVELVNGDAGGLYLYRPERDVLEWAMKVDPHTAPMGTVLQRAEGLSGRIWDSGEPLIVDDYRRWEGRAAVYDDYPFKAVVGVPVRWGEEFLGVLNVLAETPGAFSPADAEMLSLFATQAAIAIRNARSFEAERQLRELAEALEQAAAVLTATLDFEQVLDHILEQVARVIPGDAANIMLIEEGKARIARWRGYERFGAQEFVSTVVFPISEVPNLRQMMETGEAMIIPDTTAYPGWIHIPAQQWLWSYAAVPILVHGEVIGFLNVDSATPGFFTQDHLRPLRAFADHAAAAIENAKLYSELRDYAGQLEARVAERTAELQKRMAEAERLNRATANLLEDLQSAQRLSQQASRRLEEINVALETFTFSVSHDLRAPLRALQGFAAALQEDYAERLDAVGQDYAQRIVAAAQRMDTLIRDLLAYSRLSRVDIRLTSLSLQQVVAQALAQLETDIQEKGALVTVEEPLPEVLGHRATLVQVVVNLIANALKFVAPGVRPQVRIWAELRTACGSPIADTVSTPQPTVPQSAIRNPQWVRLWVEDNGIGIAPEHQQRIFRIFERLHGIEAHPGTGVGLAIVAKGVERIGGRVGVESEVGKGSRFWVELPGAGSVTRKT